VEKQLDLGGGTLWSKSKSATAAEWSPLELEHGRLPLPIQGLLGRLHKLCSVSAQDNCRLAAGGCVRLPRGEVSCPNVLCYCHIIRRVTSVGVWPFSCRHKYVLKLHFSRGVQVHLVLVRTDGLSWEKKCAEVLLPVRPFKWSETPVRLWRPFSHSSFIAVDV
jgi:hypothetical protein